MDKKVWTDDPVLQQDLEEIAASDFVDWEAFKGKTVLVTGATGLIGGILARALVCASVSRGLGIRFLAVVRNLEKAETLFDGFTENGLEILVRDILAPIEIEEPVDYIIHGAGVTASKDFVDRPVETILTTLKGTENLLEMARRKEVSGMVYLSSMEAYGVVEPEHYVVREQDYGYIDPMNVRSSYSEGKRMVECLCVSYAKEYNVPVKVARLSQTFGTGVEYNDGRVFAEFIRCAMEKKDIVLHTAGNTVRSYCYSKDAVSAILYILLNGENAEAYNVTNMDTAISIRDMAELVCSIYPESGIRTRIEIPEDVSSFGYNPEMIIRLDSTKLSKLGWKATVDLPDMFIRMRKSIEERI